MAVKRWKMVESYVARGNQSLYDAKRGVILQIPTHLYGGIPCKWPKVDFMGNLDGVPVMIEAKSGKARTTKEQETVLTHNARYGGVSLVIRETEIILYLPDGAKQKSEHGDESWYENQMVTEYVAHLKKSWSA